MAGPQSRRKARCRALEFLFGLEFTHDDWGPALEHFWETFPTRDAVRTYARSLVQGVEEQRVLLDAHIDSALRNWKPERVGRVERNILRLALFEMEHVEGVPPKVAINEAVELAKSYGTDDSPGFINAVLDRLKESSLRESRA